MQKIWDLSRRKFLRLLGATGLLRASEPVGSALATPAAAPASGYKVLRPGQVAALEAIAEQIIPADQDPGAREGGAVHYLDNVLAGYQSERLPLYAAGLEGTEQTSHLLFGRDFVKLSFDQQTTVLKSLEQDTAQGEV